MKGCTTAGVFFRELFFDGKVNKEQHAVLHPSFIRKGGTVVRINGKDAPDAVSLSVLEYLEQSSYKLQHVVVELNEEILPKEAYDKTILNDGDVLEILSFMGGGSGA